MKADTRSLSPSPVLLLTRPCLFSSDSNDSHDVGRCLSTKPTEPKYFYYGEKPISVGIFTTDRLTHRLASTVLQGPKYVHASFSIHSLVKLPDMHSVCFLSENMENKMFSQFEPYILYRQIDRLSCPSILILSFIACPI